MKKTKKEEKEIKKKKTTTKKISKKKEIEELEVYEFTDVEQEIPVDIVELLDNYSC